MGLAKKPNKIRKWRKPDFVDLREETQNMVIRSLVLALFVFAMLLVTAGAIAIMVIVSEAK